MMAVFDLNIILERFDVGEKVTDESRNGDEAVVRLALVCADMLVITVPGFPVVAHQPSTIAPA